MIAVVLAANDAIAVTTPPAWAAAVSVAAGSLVGLSLGLTGGGVNPNRTLVEKLLANGVEVWVCGQSTIRGGHTLADVVPGIRVAQSAMIFNLNSQTDGWATLGVY